MKNLFLILIFSLILMSQGHSETDVADVRYQSYFNGKSYTYTVTQKEFDEHSTWPHGSQNPSASTRRVRAAADTVIKTQFKESGLFRFAHFILHPGNSDSDGNTTKWFYEVVYSVEPNKAAWGNGPVAPFSVIVLLDGTAIIPVVEILKR